MTVLSAYSEFIIDKRVSGYSLKTIEYYSSVLSTFFEFCGSDLSVSDLSLSMCKSYYLYLLEKDISSISVQSYIRGLRAFLNWLYSNDFITVDICSKFKLPKATKKVIDVLSDAEITRLLWTLSGDEFLSVRNRLIVSLMLDSGLRLNEVVGLTWSSVHLKERYLIVTGKGDKQRIVPFGSYTYTSLKTLHDFCRTQNAIVTDRVIVKESAVPCAYEPVTESTIKNMFRKLKKRSNIPRLYPHLLRHTFATRYLENGGNIYTLQAILGHSSLEMVKKYLHLASTRIRSDFPRFSPIDNIKKDPPF